MIETEYEFGLKKWTGTVLGVLFTIAGLVSLIRQKTLFPIWSRYHPDWFIPVEGMHAILTGIGYLGTGISFIGFFFLPYSNWFHRFDHAVQAIGLILVAIGIFGSHGYWVTH